MCPSVSIIVLNFNGEKFIERCLTSVFNTNYPNFEVIFVDNGSTDQSLSILEKKFGNHDRLSLIANDRNLGPAKGYNVGAKKAGGKYLVFLNNDVEVDPHWLTELVKVMEQNPSVGAAGCKQLLMNDRKRIDDVGGYLDAFGFVYPRCHHPEIDSGQYDKITGVFRYGITALIIRKEIFNYIGGFDSKYFMWYEDNDLCWRVHLVGYKIVSVPTARIYHAVSGTVRKVRKTLSHYYNERNRIITLIKNYSLISLLKILYAVAILEMIQIFLFTILNKPRYAISTIKACTWVITNFNDVWRRHETVQRIRKISDRKIMTKFVKLRILSKFSTFQEIVARAQSKEYTHNGS